MRQVLMALLVVAVLFTATSAFAGDCGDVNNSGIVNALDITYLINYLYKGGPPPTPLPSADANNNDTINALDITYLINYLYKHGPKPSGETVTDIDGNIHMAVKIGNQWWMAENLKVTHYRNGEAIPNVTNGDTWAGLTTGAYCEYNNDVNNVATYGRLYNWFAVNDSRNIAPAGWHVASDAEWKQLEMYLGMSQAEADTTGDRGTGEGGKLKETGTTHWLCSSDTGATNESGFSALPGGRCFNAGGWALMGSWAEFWSSTDSSSSRGWRRRLTCSNSYVFRSSYYKQGGFSVRCVKDQAPALTTADVSAITETTAECGGTITSDGGVAVTARGICWSTSPTPTIADDTTNNGTGTGSFTSSITGLTGKTSYYVRAYATNSVGTGYGSISSFKTTDSMGTVTDIDGNSYRTVKIGNQWWMAENLNVTHYRNGEAIPNVTDNATWAGLATGAYCEYNNDINNVATYGRLYNWYSVNDSRNIAPTGWHVASDAEWPTLLVDYLGGSEVAGGKMKEVGTSHWASPNTGATNESGFSALPGGFRANWDGVYYNMSYSAYFWSSSEYGIGPAWYLYFDNSGVLLDYYEVQNGFSVRCVKD